MGIQLASHMRGFKKQIAALTAACLIASTAAVLTPPLPAQAAGATFEADYAVSEGPLVRTEQFNNTNYTPLPVHVVDELKGLKTKVVRDFVKINWYYNKDSANSDYLAYSIDDPRNADNPDLLSARKETYDFMSQFSDSLLISLAYSYGGDANPGKNRLLAGETTMNWPEFDKAMKKIIFTLKEKNPKLEYIEVGNEPNLEPAFYGHTKDDIPGYMRMYQGMSEAVKWVNTQGLAGQPVKVGGPVLSGYNFEKQKQFVDIAYANGYQVDFVSWHRYQEDVRMNETQEIEMKTYLHQFYPNATTIVSEYGWKGGGGLSDPTNNVGLSKQAAFMTDAAYFFARGGTDIPMNWVAVHTLNAYFKNQFDVDYALSSGDTTNWQSFTNSDPKSLQYLNLRGWRESASTSKPMKIKEIRFFDSSNNPIPIPNTANDPAIAAVTDGDEATQFTQSDYWTWLKFDLGPGAPAIARVDILWGNADINTFQLIGTGDKLHYYEVLGHTFFTPYFNTMRMFGQLGDTRIHTSGGSTDVYGTRMLATKNSDTKATMMVWNKQGDGSASANVDIQVKNLPAGFQGKSVRYKKVLVDETHSNYAYNKIDDLQIVDEGIVNAADRITLSQTLEKNAVMLIELEAVDPSIKNIVSAGKTVTVSSGMTGAANLVDGKASTAAVASTNAYPQTVQVDLGKAYYLAGMGIEWTNSAARGYTYKIETSLDGVTYTPAVDKSSNPSYVPQVGNSLEWFNGKARYVKLTVTGSTYDGPLSINEVKVFAEGMYVNGFESVADRDTSGWVTTGYSSASTPWTFATDSVTNNTYTTPVNTYPSTPSFAIFGDDLKDYGVEARVKVADSAYTGNVQMGLLARAGTYNSQYYFKLQRNGSLNQAILEKRISGTTTVLGTYNLPAPIDSATWYKLNLEAAGTTLKAFVDGVQVLEVTDASRTSGKIGLRSHEALAIFDDVKVYPLVPKLGGIQVDGVPINGFDPGINNYTVLVPMTTSTVTVTGSAYGTGSIVVAPASGQVTFDMAGQEKTYTLAALSSEGNGANYYTVRLKQASADTSLSSLRLSLVTDPLTLPGQMPASSLSLVPGQTDYTVHVPSRTKYVKVAEAVATASNVATVSITDGIMSGGTGTATVTVTSEAGTSAVYTLHLVANAEAPIGKVLYQEDFENGSFNADITSGWNNGATPNAAASHLRVVSEDQGKVLEKYTTTSMAFTVGQSDWTNYDVRARVKAQVGTALPGIIARASDDGKNFYMLRIHNGTNGLPGGSTGYIALGRAVNGSLKELDSKKIPYPYIVGNWYQLRLVVDGNRIKGYVDDNLIFDEIDNGALFSGNPPALTKGKSGIRVANQLARIDDFLVTEISDVVVPPVDPPAEQPTFTVQGTLSRTGGLSANVTLNRTAGTPDHAGSEIVFFQLLKGTTPVAYTAVESDLVGGQQAAGHFDVTDPDNADYHVHVFVVSDWSALNDSLSASLSNKIDLP
ncbi:family 16 glycoside hydrolase [Paenibacillus ferrarius]|uniref:family 16 glycoside hydrolase n=1 Tax=Paenibacillus ferrarius TaxID=1469647 RepID=UPI003D290D29